MFAFRGGTQADMTIKGTDHLVLLVSDIESGVRTWRDNLGLTLSHRVDLPEIGMAQAFFLLDDGTFIELIAPTVETSPLNAALESRGEGVHVAAMRVDDLVCAVSELKARGVRLVGEGTEQVFIDPASANGVLVQLWPSDRPHRWQAAPSEGR